MRKLLIAIICALALASSAQASTDDGAWGSVINGDEGGGGCDVSNSGQLSEWGGHGFVCSWTLFYDDQPGYAWIQVW